MPMAIKELISLVLSSAKWEVKGSFSSDIFRPLLHIREFRIFYPSQSSLLQT